MEEHADAGIGATLRDAREAQGRSREDLAEALRVRVAQIRALEEEEFAGFGGAVYVRGFLRSYAAEVDIDSGPLMDRYDQFYGGDEIPTPTLMSGSDVRSSTRTRSPAWMMWVLIAVAVLVGIGALASLGSGRTPEQASPDDEPVGPPPASSSNDDDPPDAGDADDADDATDPDADDAPRGDADDDADDDSDDDADDGSGQDADEDDAEQEPEGAEVVLALEDQSWVRVIIDGAVFMEETVEAGETLRFSGEEIEARFGNAGGVYAELNGEDLGAQGGRGEVVDVVFTSEGAEVQ